MLKTSNFLLCTSRLLLSFFFFFWTSLLSSLWAIYWVDCLSLFHLLLRFLAPFVIWNIFFCSLILSNFLLYFCVFAAFVTFPDLREITFCWTYPICPSSASLLVTRAVSSRSTNPPVNSVCEGSRLCFPHENLMPDDLRWSWDGGTSAAERLQMQTVFSREVCLHRELNKAFACRHIKPLLVNGKWQAASGGRILVASKLMYFKFTAAPDGRLSVWIQHLF